MCWRNYRGEAAYQSCLPEASLRRSVYLLLAIPALMEIVLLLLWVSGIALRITLVLGYFCLGPGGV